MSMNNDRRDISRRDFAKAAALTTAAVLVPSEILSQQKAEAAKTDKPPETPKLSAESQGEADLAYETLMRKYGSRFSEEQKREIKRLVVAQQQSLDKLRAFKVGNSNEPATVFKPFLTEGKP